MYWKFLWNLVFHPLVDEFTLTLDISTIFNGLRNEFQFGGRSASRRGKIEKKSLKNIILITNLPLFVGTGSTNGGKKMS